jgi:hypothetical protein
VDLPPHRLEIYPGLCLDLFRLHHFGLGLRRSASKPFMTPNNTQSRTDSSGMKFVSGGMSGISQNITLILADHLPLTGRSTKTSLTASCISSSMSRSSSWRGLASENAFAIFHIHQRPIEVSLFSNLLGQSELGLPQPSFEVRSG